MNIDAKIEQQTAHLEAIENAINERQKIIQTHTEEIQSLVAEKFASQGALTVLQELKQEQEQTISAPAEVEARNC